MITGSLEKQRENIWPTPHYSPFLRINSLSHRLIILTSDFQINWPSHSNNKFKVPPSQHRINSLSTSPSQFVIHSLHDLDRLESRICWVANPLAIINWISFWHFDPSTQPLLVAFYQQNTSASVWAKTGSFNVGWHVTGHEPATHNSQWDDDSDGRV
jgi:hypothetical protein